MKKLILSVFTVFATLSSFAQTISFGVKAGVNFSNQSLSGSGPYGLSREQSVTGFNAGGVLNIGFGNFVIQPGLFFTTKGGEIPSYLDPDLTTQGYYPTVPKTTFVLKYIELPLNVIYNISVSKALAIELGVGGYWGHAVSGTSRRSSSQINDFTSTQSSTIPYKNPDEGVNFIAGLILKKKYLIEAKYSLGLSNVSGANFTLPYPATDIKNMVLGVSVGYLFK